MSRESIDEKGRRYLGEGRLLVERVDEDGARARCRGGGALYELGFSTEDGWSCSCPARGRCAHLAALELVVAVPRLTEEERRRRQVAGPFVKDPEPAL